MCSCGYARKRAAKQCCASAEKGRGVREGDVAHSKLPLVAAGGVLAIGLPVRSDIKHLPCKRQAAHAGAALAPDRFLVVGWVAVVRSQRVGRRQSNLSVHHGPGLSRFARGGVSLRSAMWRRSPRAADHEHVPSPPSAPPAPTAPFTNPQTTAPAWSVVRA